MDTNLSPFTTVEVFRTTKDTVIPSPLLILWQNVQSLWSSSALLVMAEGNTPVILHLLLFTKCLSVSRHLFPAPTPIFAGGANDRWVRSVSFSHDGLHIASLADDK